MEPAVTDAPAPAPRGRRRSLVRVLGGLVAVVAVVLLVRALADEWSTIGPAVRDLDPVPLAGAFVCSAAAMTGLALLWWRCLHLFGSPASAADSIAWYFGGELGKYLPGGVWQVLGRGELARRGGHVTRSAAYATTLISYGAMCVGAGVACGLVAPFLALSGRGLGYGWLMVALVPLGLAAIHPAVLGRILALGRRVTKGRLDLQAPPWGRMLVLVLWSVPTWVFTGLAAVLVTESLGFDQSPARVAFAAVAAWIIGFLAIPVPAGAGLRELLFVGISGLVVGPGAAVAALSRLLFIVVDGVGGLLGLGRARAAAAAPPTDD